MRHRTGFGIQVQRRICHLQRTVKVDTQDLRDRWIGELDELFGMASSIAKGKVTQQQVGDKMQSITPRERQMWARVAANIGMVMGNLSRGFDERQVNKDLDELQRLLAEVKGAQAGKADETSDPSTEAKPTKDDSTKQ